MYVILCVSIVVEEVLCDYKIMFRSAAILLTYYPHSSIAITVNCHLEVPCGMQVSTRKSKKGYMYILRLTAHPAYL